MYQTSTNITPKYYKETHYNYIKKIVGSVSHPLPGKKEIQKQVFLISEHGFAIRNCQRGSLCESVGWICVRCDQIEFSVVKNNAVQNSVGIDDVSEKIVMKNTC